VNTYEKMWFEKLIVFSEWIFIHNFGFFFFEFWSTYWSFINPGISAGASLREQNQ
jgi:hypothetical protein